MTEFAFLIPLLQLFSFLMIVFFLRWKEKLAAGWSIASILSSWVMSVWVLVETLGRHGPLKSYSTFTLAPNLSSPGW